MIVNREFLEHGSIEILTGLLWILVTLGVESFFKFFKARTLEKKFPIAGTYLTRYADKGKFYTDVVKLCQSGSKVRGESVPNFENALNSRKWIFEGVVKEEGYLYGSYKPETSFDKGFGAFFLQIGKDGDMNGYWLGKDSDESAIQWGTYTFAKQPVFNVSPIQTNDVTRVFQIAEQQLGDAYIDSAALKIDADHIALCAKVQGTVVAFATARMMQADLLVARFEDCLGKDGIALRPFQRRINGEKNIGLVASAATASDFMGRGIGAELIGRCIEGLEEKGANVIAATAWCSRDGVQAGPILECKGFQKLLEIPNYWEKDSAANGYSCPTCGAPPCHCSAVLYIRNCHASGIKNKRTHYSATK